MYIEPARGYFARYSGRTRTHKFDVEEWTPDADIPQWVEWLRTDPSTWEKVTNPEAA